MRACAAAAATSAATSAAELCAAWQHAVLHAAYWQYTLHNQPAGAGRLLPQWIDAGSWWCLRRDRADLRSRQPDNLLPAKHDTAGSIVRTSAAAPAAGLSVERRLSLLCACAQRRLSQWIDRVSRRLPCNRSDLRGRHPCDVLSF